MAIRGSLREASLVDVVQLLAHGKKSGCLSVTHRQHFGYIYFDGGRICYAAIVNRRDRLGDMFVKNGLLAREALDEVLAEQAAEPDVRLGELLIARRLLSREDVERHLLMQIEEAVYFLLTWDDGSFNFEPEVRPDEGDLMVSINAESLLLEGARRVDEWSQIAKRVPSLDAVFELDRAHLAASGVELDESQRTLAALIDGHRDVTALSNESGVGEFETGKALYALAAAGFLRRIGRVAPTEPVVSDTRVREHRNLGVAFYKAGMLDEAEREFRRVVELRADDEQAESFLALVLLRRERWHEAVSALQPLAARPDASPSVHHNLALALERLGRDDDARAALAPALRASKPDARSLMSAAVLALRARDLAGAEQSLAAAADALGARERPAVWYHAASLAAGLAGDTPRAVRILIDGVSAHPRSAVLLNNLSAALERSGRAGDAAQAAERGMVEDSTLAQLHKNLGDLHYRAARYDEALSAYQRALRQDPELGSDVHLKIANIHFRRDDRSEAARAWTRAVEIDPTNEIARANLASLEHAC